MPRRVQDIIPSGRRTIRDIPLHDHSSDEDVSPRRREKEVEIKIHKPAKDHPVGNIISLEQEKPERRRSGSKKGNGMKMLMIFIGSIVLIAVAVYFAAQFYAIARFTIVPKSYPVKANKTIVAQATSAVDAVNYSILTVTEKASVEVPSTDGPYQETKASGKVTIYNDYSSATQRLIAGTRLATSDGLVYRMSSSATVPGKTVKGPGQITVSVVADKAGQEYNISQGENKTLRLLGFTGTPKYEGFYGKLSGDLSGGFAGRKKNISAVDMSSSTAFLSSSLRAILSSKIHDELKDEYMLFDQGLLLSTSSPLIEESGSSTSKILMTGTMNAIVFDKQSLTSRLVGEEIMSNFEPYQFDIIGLDNLEVTFTNLKDFSVSKKNTLLANFEGEIKVVARIPIDEIKSRLIGLPLSETQKVIRSYSSINGTESRGQVMPPWSKVPTRVDNIRIEIEEVE